MEEYIDAYKSVKKDDVFSLEVVFDFMNTMVIVKCPHEYFDFF